MNEASSCDKCIEFYRTKVWSALFALSISDVKKELNRMGIVCDCDDNIIVNYPLLK